MSSKSNDGSIGLGVILAIVFTVLKLTDVIDWSWWWVLSPVWIPLSISLLCVMVVLMFFREK